MPTSRDLTFTADDDVEFSGTLLLPDGDGPHPAALLLVGSGPVDRDSNLPTMQLAVTQVLAEALADAGIATYRYDKRGVGDSGGDFVGTSFATASTDAASALAALAAAEEVDPDRLLVVGHSEGSLHATSIAATHPDLAGVALISAPAVSGEATLRWQAKKLVPTLPLVVRILLRALRLTPDRTQEKLFRRVRRTDASIIRVQGKPLNAAWLREFLDHDPSDELPRIEVPVFALTGERDLQVDPEDLDRIRDLVTRAEVETHCPAGVNHILRHTQGTGSATEYRQQLQEGRPVATEVLDVLTAWATARVRPS